MKPQPKAGSSDPAQLTHIHKVEGGWEKKSRRLEVSPSGVARIELRGAGAESDNVNMKTHCLHLSPDSEFRIVLSQDQSEPSDLARTAFDGRAGVYPFLGITRSNSRGTRSRKHALLLRIPAC